MPEPSRSVGLIERGDIHRAMVRSADLFGGVARANAKSDDLAEDVWQLYNRRTDAEAVVNAMAAGH